MTQQPTVRRTDLHRVWIAAGASADEARRVQADIEHMQHGEAIRDSVALNLQMAMAGALATAIAIRLYHLAMDGVMGLTGGALGTPAAATK